MIVTLIGKFHFLLLHFPIALAVAALAFDVLMRRHLNDDKRSHTVRFLLTFAAIGALVTVVSGLAYAQGEDYAGTGLEHLNQHRNLGFVTTFLLVLGRFTYKANFRVPALRMPLLAVAVAGVAWTGHLGGELVHGENYFSLAPKVAPAPVAAAAAVPAPTDDAPTVASDGDEPHAEPQHVARERYPEGTVVEKPDYQTHIAPLLERSCTKCHGAEKRKGGLRLDAKRFAFKGGESGAAVVPSDVAGSLLIKYIAAPEDDEDIMPPKGKLLAQSEIDTIKNWIAQGAVWPDPAPAPRP